MTNKKRMKVTKKTKHNVNKKNTKRNKYNYKNIMIVGGDDLSSDKRADKIMDEVKKERKSSFNLENFPVLKKTSELAGGLILKGIEDIGKLLGVDLSNTQNINEKLEQIKVALADPKNKEKMREIINEASKFGAVAIEAASPFIEPLLDKTIKVGTKAMSKIGESAVKIGLNTAEEIPGVGIAIGTARSLSNAGEAFLAASGATNQIIAASADTINATSKNFQQLMKEKMNTTNRVNKSLDNFQSPVNIPTNSVTNNNDNNDNNDKK